jgi:hypothetical protein
VHVLQTGRRSGSRAEEWEREWLEAEGVERAEAVRRRSPLVLALVATAALALVLPAIFPLAPGYSPHDTLAQIVAAAIAAGVAIAVVPVTGSLSRYRPDSRARLLLLGAAMSSAGAAAIHLAVAKMHFEEYALFGVFFVGAGIAQLAWPIWVVLRPSRWLLALGTLGNVLITALWAVDRIWGLPIGPEHWKADPVGFGDSVASGFEVVLAGGCLLLLARVPARAARVGAAAAAIFATVVTLTALSLLSAVGVGASFLTPTA